jgi:superfamily I DNA/RNA helicase
LAAEYYVGLESGIAEIPTRSGPPIVFENHKIDRTTAFMINRYHQQNPKAEIGVLLPTKRQVKRFVNVLKNMLKDPTQLHWYYRDSDKPVGEPKFDMPGINVLTHASSKGLEFDAVFLPELQALPHSDPTEASVRMKLYVLFSRARDRLFISYTGEKTPIIEDIESALRRNGLLDKQEPDF